MGNEFHLHSRLREAQVSQFLIGKRVKGVRSVCDLSCHAPGLTLLARLANRDQLSHRPLPAYDDHFLAGRCFLKKARKIGLRLLNCIFHSVPDSSRTARQLKFLPSRAHAFALIICSACLSELSVTFAPLSIRATSSVRSSPVMLRTVVLVRPADSFFSMR